METKIKIELERNDWGQLLDGLICRAEQYEVTARYFETGSAEDLILEVRDAHEAKCLADRYREIIARIQAQL